MKVRREKRNRDQGNNRGPDVLQKDEDHDGDEYQRFDNVFIIS